jgi:hypothetical protein
VPNIVLDGKPQGLKETCSVATEVEHIKPPYCKVERVLCVTRRPHEFL